MTVVSIARTKSKLKLEGPFIGEAVVAAIGRSAQVRDPKRIGVLGYGVIGKAAVEALEYRFPDAHITVVDTSDDALRRAHDGGSRRSVGKSLSVGQDYDLLVGCTGTTSFNVEDRQLLADDAVLASGSSAAIEFDRAGFVDLADYYPNDEIEVLDRANTRAAGIHADIRFRFEGERQATFLNAGFPVNFDGRSESLAAHMIQGTRSLIYSGVAQAIASPQPGLTTLSSDIDNWIYQNALSFL
jgi:threonine dehydrogenase-like Zn-dependent dehydrogenase